MRRTRTYVISPLETEETFNSLFEMLVSAHPLYPNALGSTFNSLFEMLRSTLRPSAVKVKGYPFNSLFEML